ncbi:MAG: DUF4292 domain-containing protein [Thiohalospira sp.]
MPYKYSRYCFFLFLLFTFIQCKVTDKTVISEKETSATINEIDSNIFQNKLSSDGIIITGAKITILANNKTQKLRANLKIKPDSAILISLSNPLGIEIVRALLTKDSVQFIDRINRNFLAGKFSVISGMYNIPLNFNQLEKSLTDVHSLYFLSQHQTTKKIRSQRGVYTILKKNQEHVVEYTIDNHQFFIKKTYFNFPKYSRIVSIDYSNYTKFENGFFPEDILINIKEKNKNIQLEINYNNIRFEPVTISLDVPESYQRIYP